MNITLKFTLRELHFIESILVEAVRNGISAGVRNSTSDWTADVRVALSIQEKISEVLPVMMEATNE